MAADGSYTDWVAHLSQIRNKFQDSYNDRTEQKGWQLALGVEKGLPLSQFQALSQDWTLEGQGQAVLLHTSYSGFEDKLSRMKGESFEALRGRLGVRVHNTANPQAQGGGQTRYYALAHLVHDLVKTDKMTVAAKAGGGQVKVGETFDQTYLEVGVGLQTQVAEGAWLWADARYEAGLQNRKDTGKVTFGFKKSF